MLGSLKTLLKVIIGLCIIIFQFNIALTENVVFHVSSNKILNEVSEKFISFTVDPKTLLEMHDESKKFDYMLLGKSLSPAYIRIAGPSTHEMSLDNSVTRLKSNIDKKNPHKPTSHEFQNNDNSLTNLEQWNTLLKWVKTANFTPFIALNNAEKIFNGNWNPKEAIKVLSMVDKMKLGECIWQLGYECAGQTSEKYLNDLKTMKILMDAFTSRKNGDWKLASGDIHNCLGEHPSTELYSFLMRSSDFLDVVVLNSYVTVDPLDILEEKDQKYIKSQYAEKNTQLWSAFTDSMLPDDEEAINWLNTLGGSAVDGYSVVFKELTQADLIEPTLSFFVSLLHKKLVGPKVLEVLEEVLSVDLSVFAHCTNLPSILPGAVTLFATNAGDEASTISINMPDNENGGEIIQYLLQQSDDGKIFVNGKVMNNEGDLKPKIKKVQEFKKENTLLTFSLPPKSIGFWIATMANFKACLINKPDGLNTVYSVSNNRELQNAAEILQRNIHDVSKASLKRFVRSVEYHHNDDSIKHEQVNKPLRPMEEFHIRSVEEEKKVPSNGEDDYNVAKEELKSENDFIDQHDINAGFNNMVRKNIEIHDSSVYPVKEQTDNPDFKGDTISDHFVKRLINKNENILDGYNESTEISADFKIVEESTKKSLYSGDLSDNPEKMSIDIVKATPGIQIPIEEETADDKVFESPKTYQETLPCDRDGKNLTIIVIETTNSSTDPSFNELFAILGQIASMLELEKEFLDIGSAVLTPDSDNPLTKSDYTGLKELTILEHGKKFDDGINNLKPIVTRAKRENDEKTVAGEVDDLEIEEDNPADAVGSSSHNLRYELPPLPHLPSLPQLPRLSKLSRQKVPRKNIDSLVERAERLMRNINPNLLDGARSESRLNPQFAKFPMDARAHDLNLKSQLAKNKFKIEQLRNKIQARMADYELKTKSLLNRNSRPSRLFKRDINENTIEKGTPSDQKITPNNKIQRKLVKPLFNIKKNMKKYFSKLKKSVDKKKSFKGLSKYSNKIGKDNSAGMKKSLRMKRFVDNGVDKEEINNDIFSIDDFEYKDKINKDSSEEKKGNSIFSSNNKQSNDYSGKVDALKELNSHKNIDKVKSEISVNCNEKANTGIPCEAKKPTDNAILKLESISEIQDDSDEIPETKVRCLHSDMHDVKSEEISWEDIKGKVGFSDEKSLNAMMSDVASFFQTFPKKIQEFWQRLGGEY